jgi:hypothetical protein
MKINWKTLLQAMIIPIIGVLISIFCYYQVSTTFANPSGGLASAMGSSNDDVVQGVLFFVIVSSIIILVFGTLVCYLIINYLKTGKIWLN